MTDTTQPRDLPTEPESKGDATPLDVSNKDMESAQSKQSKTNEPVNEPERFAKSSDKNKTEPPEDQSRIEEKTIPEHESQYEKYKQHNSSGNSAGSWNETNCRDNFNFNDVAGGVNFNTYQFSQEKNGFVEEVINKDLLEKEKEEFIPYPDFDTHVNFIRDKSLCLLKAKYGSGREFLSKMMLCHMSDLSELIFLRGKASEPDLKQYAFKEKSGYIVDMKQTILSENELFNLSDKLHSRGSKLIIIYDAATSLPDNRRVKILSFPDFIVDPCKVFSARINSNQTEGISDAYREQCISLVCALITEKQIGVGKAAEFAKKVLDLISPDKTPPEEIVRVLEYEAMEKTVFSEKAETFVEKMFVFTLALLEYRPNEEIGEAFIELVGALGQNNEDEEKELHQFLSIPESERCHQFQACACEKRMDYGDGEKWVRIIQFNNKEEAKRILNYVLQEYPQWYETILVWLIQHIGGNPSMRDSRITSLEIFLFRNYEKTLLALETDTKIRGRYFMFAQTLAYISKRITISSGEREIEYYRKITDFVHNCAMSKDVKLNILSMYSYAFSLSKIIPGTALPDMYNLMEAELRRRDYIRPEVYDSYCGSFAILFGSASTKETIYIFRMLERLIERNTKVNMYVYGLFLLLMRIRIYNSANNRYASKFLEIYGANIKVSEHIKKLWKSALNSTQNQDEAKQTLQAILDNANHEETRALVAFLNDLRKISSPLEQQRLNHYWDSLKRSKELVKI